MSPTFHSLANPNYRRYAAGNLVSNVGTWMQRVAQDWLILLLASNSAMALGITTGLQFLPFLLLSPFAGLIADRIPKRRLLQMTNLGMALPALILGVLAVTGAVQIWHIYVLALILGISSAFDAPARQSFVSEVVDADDLANAVGLNSAGFNAARLIGPALAGVLIGVMGAGVKGTGIVILINSVSYLAPILTLHFLNAAQLRPSVPVGREPGQVRAGVAYIRSRPDLMVILGIVFFAGTFGLNFQIAIPLMATQVFDRGPTAYGLLATFVAVGSLSGALLAARRAAPSKRIIALAAVSFGVVEMVAGLAPTYLAFAILCPLMGLMALTMMTSAVGYMQLRSGPQMRGRVMALYMMVFMGGTPLGAPVVGWVGESFGPRWTLIAGGAITALGAIVCVVWYWRQQRILTGVEQPGNVGSRVWDNQTVAHAQG